MWPGGRVHRQQSDSTCVSYLSGCFSSRVRMSFMLPNKCPQFSSRLNANASFQGSAIKRCFFTWMQPRINFHRGRPDLDTYVYTWDMLLLWATTATGRPKIETGSSIGEQNNTLKPATLNVTAKKKGKIKAHYRLLNKMCHPRTLGLLWLPRSTSMVLSLQVGLDIQYICENKKNKTHLNDNDGVFNWIIFKFHGDQW